MSWKIEALVEKAIEDGVLPGAVLFARDASGRLNYAKALGSSSLDPSSPQPMQLDTVFTLASLTKLLTTIAVLQLVDRGLLTPDTDVAPYLPDLAAKPILTGFSPAGDPILVPRTRPILVRHLLTHSSGCGYDFLSPVLASYCAAVNHPSPSPIANVAARFDHPLLFEPGTGWSYGSSFDWAGVLVSTLTHQPLETYLAENILAPLSLPRGCITFYPERHHHASSLGPATVAAMTDRDPVSHRVVHAPLPTPAPDRVELGGEGASASLAAFVEVLASLLRDDGRLLAPATSQLLFQGQLREAEAKAALRTNVKHPAWIVGWVPDAEYDWSFGGLVVDGEAGCAWRRRGFVSWAGVFNLCWFIDRTAGVTGLFGTQILQPADPLVRPLMKAFEEEVFSKGSSSLD